MSDEKPSRVRSGGSPLPEALRDALGQVIADQRREWRRERELMEAQARSVIAELRAEHGALTARMDAMVAERLATLRDGKDGVNGKDGRDGAPGERGPPGPPGKLPAIRAWEDAVHYAGDVVTHGGSVYQAQRDTGREPPHDDWLCIARAGQDGAVGRSMTIRGTWSEGETYRCLDVVALNGGSFVARRDDPGPCPGEGWQLVASQGRRGLPGEAGKPGLRGEQGPPGPGLLEAAVDEDGLVTLTNGDQSRVALDLYPVLSRIAH